MCINWMKLTKIGFGAAAFAAALALALPAQADKISQIAFEVDCEDDGGDGTVVVAAGTSLEVVNGLTAAPAQSIIDENCVVTLGAGSEFTLAEDTDLLFRDNGTFKNFTIMGAGAKIKVQVKKNSTIAAFDFKVMVPFADAEAQFGEDLCLLLGNDLLLTLGTSSSEGGSVQFKKVTAATAPSCGLPNINVGGNMTVTVDGNFSEIQIEEANEVVAGGSILLTANDEGGKVQTKKGVMLKTTASGDGDIKLKAAVDGGDTNGDAQVEEGNVFDADGDIEVASGADGKTEVKKGTDFDADDDITVSSVGECKIGANVAGDWTAGGTITTTGCTITP